jgi:hypothetical protein
MYALGHVKNANAMFVDEAQAITKLIVVFIAIKL